MRAVTCIALAVSISCGGAPPPELMRGKPAAGPASAAQSSVAAPVAAAQPANPAAPVIPETAAGRTLAAWLDAFNSGDVTRMYEFVDRYKDPMGRRIANVREETGGFDLVAIETSQPRSITFVVKEKASPAEQVGFLRVADADPAVIESFALVVIPPGMKAADIRTEIDAETAARIVEALGKTLNAQYVYPALAKQMTQALHDHLVHGDDKALATGPDLAFALTHQMQEVAHDRHVRVEWLPRIAPPGTPDPTDEERQQKQHLEQIHCGFVKTERLDGNIGYIKIDAFEPVQWCGAKATDAFATLKDVDALIFDLRGSGGGVPEMVTYVESYLFAKRTHLYDMYTREDNKLTPNWTNPDVPGAKLVTQPVYVLTSARTFSGAEAFAYDLQTMKRATIIGETTGGGAHPTHPVPLDDHFVLMVPSARAINVVTKTDWEGTGVHPDVNVPADQALDKAKQLAADELAKRRAARR